MTVAISACSRGFAAMMPFEAGVQRLAVDASDLGSGLAQDDHSRRGVPGLQAELPETVGTSGRDVAAVDRCRAVASHSVYGRSKESGEYVELSVERARRDRRGSPYMSESRQDRSTRSARDSMRHFGSAPEPVASREELLGRDVVDGAGDRVSVAQKRHRDRIARESVDERGGAVERVDRARPRRSSSGAMRDSGEFVTSSSSITTRASGSRARISCHDRDAGSDVGVGDHVGRAAFERISPCLGRAVQRAVLLCGRPAPQSRGRQSVRVREQSHRGRPAESRSCVLAIVVFGNP